MSALFFEVISVLGKKIRTTKDYWNYVVTIKHPSVRGLEDEVERTLKEPKEVRRSREDPDVHLYYGKYMEKLICVVVKHLNNEGYIITAYLTRRMVGETLWKRSL